MPFACLSNKRPEKQREIQTGRYNLDFLLFHQPASEKHNSILEMPSPYNDLLLSHPMVNNSGLKHFHRQHSNKQIYQLRIRLSITKFNWSLRCLVQIEQKDPKLVKLECQWRTGFVYCLPADCKIQLLKIYMFCRVMLSVRPLRYTKLVY